PGYGTELWESPVLPGGPGPDGTSIGLGVLTGYIYTNCNNGEVWELGLPGGPAPNSLTLIASGGSVGDFIAADPNVYSSGGYPTMLLTQTDRIMRLGGTGGGFFG